MRTAPDRAFFFAGVLNGLGSLLELQEGKLGTSLQMPRRSKRSPLILTPLISTVVLNLNGIFNTPHRDPDRCNGTHEARVSR